MIVEVYVFSLNVCVISENTGQPHERRLPNFNPKKKFAHPITIAPFYPVLVQDHHLSGTIWVDTGD